MGSYYILSIVLKGLHISTYELAITLRIRKQTLSLVCIHIGKWWRQEMKPGCLTTECRLFLLHYQIFVKTEGRKDKLRKNKQSMLSP